MTSVPYECRPATAADLIALHRCDFSFTVTDALKPPYTDLNATYPVARTEKNYGYNSRDIQQETEENDAVVLIAVNSATQQPAGFIVLSQHWNRLASVEDFAVDRYHRGTGAAALLIQAAKDWAKQEKLAGLRLETQHNNVTACRFYARHGFECGGYDRLMYRALAENQQDVALYWYLFFN